MVKTGFLKIALYATYIKFSWPYSFLSQYLLIVDTVWPHGDFEALLV